jgi:hypothetical protein
MFLVMQVVTWSYFTIVIGCYRAYIPWGLLQMVIAMHGVVNGTPPIGEVDTIHSMPSHDTEAVFAKRFLHGSWARNE